MSTNPKKRPLNDTTTCTDISTNLEELKLQDTTNNNTPNKKHTSYQKPNNFELTYEDTIDEFEEEMATINNKNVKITENDEDIKLSDNILTKNISNNNNNNNNNYNNYNKLKDSCLDLNWSDDEYMEDNSEIEDTTNDNTIKQDIWPPNMKPKNNNIKFEYDNSAYNILHRFNMKWPCLSFDIIYDKLGVIRNTIPYEMYLVTGTQADNNNNNSINILKISQLQKTKYDDDIDDENEENDIDYQYITDDQPLLQNRQVKHKQTVNRIRSHKKYSNMIATFSENASVYIYDLKEHILSLDGKSNNSHLLSNQNSYINKPIFEMRNNDEGYGIEWSSKELKLLTGSCVGELCLIESQSNSTFKRTMKFKTPKYSIEDIKFSPYEPNIFATCGTDNAIKIWDTRSSANRNCVRICNNAHSKDINVISWNPFDSFLLLSGSDDNSFKIWDMRKFVNCLNKKINKKKKIKPYSFYKYHNGPITSCEWSPFQKGSLIISSEDNQLSIWDLSLENDNEIDGNNVNNNNNKVVNDKLGNLPPQLVFTHCGQENIKEIHYHPQIPNMIVSSAADGFHIFQPDNLVSEFNKLNVD